MVSTGSGGSGSTGKKQAQCGRLTWFLGVPILSARSSCARRGTARGAHTRGQTNRTHARAPVAGGACCASASTASDRFAATTAPGRHQPSEQHRVCVACDATRLQRSPPQAAGRDTQPNGHRRGARARIEDSDVPWDGCSTSQVFHVIGLIAARHDAVIHAFIGRSPSGSPARCTTGEGFFATFLWAKCALATNQPMRRSLRPMWSTSVLKGRSLRSLRCLVSSLSTNMTAIDEKSEAHGWHHP